MSWTLHDNPLLIAPKILDARYGPWSSTAAALEFIKPHMRIRGLTVGIVHISGEVRYVQEYWFRAGIQDEDLEVKGEQYTHPTGFEDQPSEPLDNLTVISQVNVNDQGHIEGVETREIPVIETVELNILADEQTEFTIPPSLRHHCILNGLKYVEGDYSVSETTLTWGDDELETDDELIFCYVSKT